MLCYYMLNKILSRNFMKFIAIQFCRNFFGNILIATKIIRKNCYKVIELTPDYGFQWENVEFKSND